MDVKLPKLGEGADSGVVVSLLVEEGDAVQQGQPLLELENEKAVASIPAPAAGTVTRFHVKPGDKVSVGQVMVTLAVAGEEAAAAATSTVAATVAVSTAPVETVLAPHQAARSAAPEFAEPVAGSLHPPPASPSVRKLARELGIDLTRVRGSESGGRIVLADLRAYVQRLQQVVFEARPAAPSAPVAISGPPPPAERIDFSKWGPVERKRMSQLRRTISRRMAENWSTIPHVHQFDEADLTRVLEFKQKYSAAYEQNGARLTVTSFVVKAVVIALLKHPNFNASVDETTQEIVLKQYCHIGVAVDTEAGLIVPVIRDADKKSLLELSKDLSELGEKARQRKVSLEELKGGTFTISNQGGIGGGHFTPIINKPEVAILGLGRSALKPVVRGGKIEPRTLLPLCLSYDHRVIDGGQAARFIVDLVQTLEQFEEEEVRL
ncbi:MAG: 2-oxo acid dehydrogenase subunit E2 [Verrucomicrobia bacterium]|nr:2-oxo acid dehydrogenase subunit E2 [Verrucomicrobiota bacterium]